MSKSKWPWIIGLGAAGAGMLVYLTRRNKPFEVVEGTAVDTVVVEQSDVPDTKSGPTLVKALLNLSSSKRSPATLVNPVTINVQRTRKRLARKAPTGVNPLRGGRSYNSDVGWLGPMVLMGHTIQALQIKFLHGRGHTSPFVPTRSDGGHPPIAVRYTSKHSEFPSPIIVPLSKGSRDFARNVSSYGLKESWVREMGLMWGTRVSSIFESKFEELARNERAWGWGFDLPLLAGLRSVNGTNCKASFDQKKSMEHPGPLDKQAYVDPTVKTNDSYDLDYYRKARWLVWAAEMYREHYLYPVSESLSGGLQSKKGQSGQGGRSSAAVTTLRSSAQIASPSSQWRFYCQQWCIGIPTSDRLAETDLLPGCCDGIHPEVVTQRIMEQIPPPGKRSLTEELSSGALADWPESLVALAPPVKFFIDGRSWTDYCHAVQAQKSGNKIETAFVKVLMGLELAALASFGAAAGGVVAGTVGGVLGAAAEATLKAAVDAAINYAETGKEPTFQWSDALAVIADKIDPGDTQFPSFEAAANHYNNVREAMDGNWGYANDLMDAIEKEYMGILP